MPSVTDVHVHNASMAKVEAALAGNPAVQMLVGMATSDEKTRRLAFQTLAKVAVEALGVHP